MRFFRQGFTGSQLTSLRGVLDGISCLNTPVAEMILRGTSRLVAQHQGTTTSALRHVVLHSSHLSAAAVCCLTSSCSAFLCSDSSLCCPLRRRIYRPGKINDVANLAGAKQA